MNKKSTPQPELKKPRLLDLGMAFMKISIASFGGGLSAWTRQIIVVERRWMGEEEFLSALTICRILPGANQVNMALFVGTQFGGIVGAMVAVFGLTFVPVLMVLALGWLYFSYHSLPQVQSVMSGVTAVAIGMTLSMAVKTGIQCLKERVSILFFAAAFVMTGIFHRYFPMVLTLLILAPLSVWWAWPQTPPPQAKHL